VRDVGDPDHPGEFPQAKGRIERNHGTQQDRPREKLRRRGIADLVPANAFLETMYWADHNARFAQPPGSSDDYHVARPRGLRLDTVFQLEETRTVSNDWVVRYHTRQLQLERQSGHAPARSTVVVHEDVAGQLEIRYRDRVMRWTEIVSGPASAVVTPPPVPISPPPGPRHRYHPARTHPWRGRSVRPNWQVPVP
jgi:hypothetical protein